MITAKEIALTEYVSKSIFQKKIGIFLLYRLCKIDAL